MNKGEKHTEEAKKMISEAMKGNSNHKGKVWSDIIRKLGIQDDHKQLHEVAYALFTKAKDGDIAAIKEIGDRIDGKSVATTEITGAEGSELPVNIAVNFLKKDGS